MFFPRLGYLNQSVKNKCTFYIIEFLTTFNNKHSCFVIARKSAEIIFLAMVSFETVGNSSYTNNWKTFKIVCVAKCIVYNHTSTYTTTTTTDSQLIWGIKPLHTPAERAVTPAFFLLIIIEECTCLNLYKHKVQWSVWETDLIYDTTAALTTLKR